MDRVTFIRVLTNCIESATHTRYTIEMERLSDQGLIQLAELVRDLLQLRLDKLEKESLPMPVMPIDGKFH